MILLGLGANLPSAAGPPTATLEAALAKLQAQGVEVVARSRWYRTTPVPRSDQPWFVNGVVSVRTHLGPDQLLALLHRIEAEFGRSRGIRNEARTLDLDILDFDGIIKDEAGLVLPHPRLHERAFVLLPLQEVAPEWRHPRLDRSVSALVAALPADQIAQPLL